jgi:hypothetical protein
MIKQIKNNLPLVIQMILFCLVILLGCKHKKTITPPEPEPKFELTREIVIPWAWMLHF